jgi:hypothetical protein
MWIAFDDRQRAVIKKVLRDRIDAHTEGDVVDATVADEVSALIHIERTEKTFDPADPYRAYLQTQADDDMEVDDDAIVSPGDDPGAFVHAWIWVRNDEAGVPDEDEDCCDTCGSPLDEAGDGYDGKCADCADKADKDTYPANWTKDDG